MQTIKSLFVDFASNTPVDRRVFRAMKPFLTNRYVGNSMSIHQHGSRTSLYIEGARATIAECLAVDPSEVLFCSGASEATNWVLKSLTSYELLEEQPRKHLVVSAIEHICILDACELLEALGFMITYIKPDKKGRINPEDVKKAIRKDTLLVCVMAVNNELGTANDIEKIGQYAHKKKVLMMSDVTQALSLGGSSMELGRLYPSVDYFAFSSHKIYGPTGVGVLVSRMRAPIHPLIHGEQEFGLRGGTLNTAGIVGMAKAIELLHKKDYSCHYYELYKYTLDLFQSELEGLPKLTVVPDHKNIMSVNFAEMFVDYQLASVFAMNGISCSAGSACDSSTGEEDLPSHVLLALDKLTPIEIGNTVRLSFSKYTTKRDIRRMVKKIKKVYNEEILLR